VRKWLKELREKRSFTMKTVAERAGISECYYSQIENGSRNCPVETAKKIAVVLGFEWTKFFE
jgi:transcriptional regulator with XRE-family HTH domain